MKNWLRYFRKSKTLMFNAAIAALLALEGVFSLVQPLVEGNVFAYASIVLAMGNAVLRTITSTSLKDK